MANIEQIYVKPCGFQFKIDTDFIASLNSFCSFLANFIYYIHFRKTKTRLRLNSPVDLGQIGNAQDYFRHAFHFELHLKIEKLS